MTEEQVLLSKIVEPLLSWYDQNARILPWRDEPTPYHVWISEMMLQQTRVEAALPYYHRFISALPDVESLAKVDDEVLIKLWEGLGYYQRARNLKKAARLILSQYGGRIPSDEQELRTLPGIGPYSAGAIASIAYGAAVPAVDGNVLRVISRLLSSEEDIAKEQTKKAMADRLSRIIPPKRAGDFNQALMEIGALLCLPKKANCMGCPLNPLCLAHRKGVADQIPVKSAAKGRRKEKRTVFLFFYQDKVALWKRGEEGLLAGMWELPNLPGHLDEKEVRAAFPAAAMADLWPLHTAKHIFSHIEWEMKAYGVCLNAPDPDWIWATLAELEAVYSLPSAFKSYRDDVFVFLANKGSRAE